MVIKVKITAQGPVLFSDEELEFGKEFEGVLKEMDSVALRALIRNNTHNLENQMRAIF